MSVGQFASELEGRWRDGDPIVLEITRPWAFEVGDRVLVTTRDQRVLVTEVSGLGRQSVHLRFLRESRRLSLDQNQFESEPAGDQTGV
jgi:hypothetical protein